MRISRFGSGTPRCRPSLARIRRFRRRNHCDKPTARHPNWREIEAFGPIRRSHRGDAGPRPPSQYQPPPVFLVATGIQSPDYAPTRSWQRRGAGWTTASHPGRLPSAQPSLHTKWALDSRCGENDGGRGSGFPLRREWRMAWSWPHMGTTTAYFHNNDRCGGGGYCISIFGRPVLHAYKLSPGLAAGLLYT